MKFWQVLAIGIAAVVLGGCAGYRAYVPAVNTGSGGGGNTGSGCAELTYCGDSTFTLMLPSGQGTGTFQEQVCFGYADDVSEGDELTVSFYNLPVGVQATFTPNPIPASTGGGTSNVEFTVDYAAADAGTYNVQVQVSRNGCSVQTFSVTIEIVDGSYYGV